MVRRQHHAVLPPAPRHPVRTLHHARPRRLRHPNGRRQHPLALVRSQRQPETMTTLALPQGRQQGMMTATADPLCLTRVATAAATTTPAAAPAQVQCKRH